ncbi:MAG TPA: type II secretion system F family protein [Dehalococcoidia bacterium]|nr:type II secretion system F family protein [Dehalococcoidia bacterium]
MIIFVIVILIFATFASATVAMMGKRNVSAMETRIQSFRDHAVERDDVDDILELSFGARVLRPAVEGLAHGATGLLPQSVLADIQRQLMMAGHPMKLNTFVTFWLVSIAAFTLIGVMMLFSLGGIQGLGLFLLLLVVGYVFPRQWLKGKVKAKQKLVIKALPDNLDLITTCVEAGLGLDAALSRVAERGEGPLALELQRMLRDVAMGKLRREAMEEMADRVGVEELTTFITSIIQAEQLGVAIAQVLRVQSDQLRTARRQRAEKAAHEAPIKMIFPLVLLIFPSFLAVILAPAAIRISQAL